MVNRSRIASFAVAVLVVPVLALCLGGWWSPVRAQEGTPTGQASVVTSAEELAAAVDAIIADFAGTLSETELAALKQQLLRELGAVLEEKGSISIDQAQLKSAASAAEAASLPPGQTVKLLRYLAEATAEGEDTTALQNLINSGQLRSSDLELALRDLQRQQSKQHEQKKNEEERARKTANNDDDEAVGDGSGTQERDRDQDRDRDHDKQHNNDDDGGHGGNDNGGGHGDKGKGGR